MDVYLLLAAIIIVICLILNKFFSKIGVPRLLAFIILGMLFGSDGIFKIPFDNFAIAEQVSTIALIFIMFYGGFGTSWREAKPVVLQSILLSTLGVILTACFTGLFCHFILRLDLLESLLIGAVISSTDAASVFSILRSKRLNLKEHTASLLEIESGSNDPCAYMLTVIILTLMKGEGNGADIFYMVFAQIAYGIGFGFTIAEVAVAVLRRVRLYADGFDSIFVVAVAILAYALPSAIGGNGYLSAYIVGIVLGNSEISNKKALVHFFDGATGLMQIMVFFLLGLLAFPSELPDVVLPALLIACFLTFVARPATIFAILTPFRNSLSQRLLVSWSGLRGAASIVFAVLAVMTVELKHDIFHIVFCIVLFSILLQGTLIPWISRWLNMIDEEGDVMKTFTDYSDEVAVQFIQFKIPKKHPWVGRWVKDIELPPGTILVMLLRGEEKIVPRGKTTIAEGDLLVLCAKSIYDIEGIHLTEKEIRANDELVGKTLEEIPNVEHKLIIMIQRRGQIIIPNGKTILREGDLLVVNHMEDLE